MDYNTYYVCRDNKIVEVNIIDILFGEVFLYIGKYSDSVHDIFYVFANKGVNNHIMEVGQNGIGEKVFTKNMLLKKFKMYKKINSHV